MTILPAPVRRRVSNRRRVAPAGALTKRNARLSRFERPLSKDTWFIGYNTGAKLPEVIAVYKGGERIVGYKIEGWADADGLKFPTILHNIAMQGEIFEFSDIGVGVPDDYDYVRSINE